MLFFAARPPDVIVPDHPKCRDIHLGGRSFGNNKDLPLRQCTSRLTACPAATRCRECEKEGNNLARGVFARSNRRHLLRSSTPRVLSETSRHFLPRGTDGQS